MTTNGQRKAIHIIPDCVQSLILNVISEETKPITGDITPLRDVVPLDI